MVIPKDLQGDFKVVERPSATCKPEIVKMLPKTAGRPNVLFQATTGGAATAATTNALNVGVVLSGGQAPGGHNVIAGVYDALKSRNPACRVFGFRNGPHGIFTGNLVELDDGFVADYRNMGGFDMIGSG